MRIVGGLINVGLCCSSNLGLQLAALADRVATAQLPIYTLPAIQRCLYHRWLAAAPPAP